MIFTMKKWMYLDSITLCPAIITMGLINHLIIKSLHLRCCKVELSWVQWEQTVQYQPLTDVVWWMLCVHLLAPTSGQHVCLVVDHPAVFVPNCPMTQRYITGPTQCYLPGTFLFCALLCPFIWHFKIQVFISSVSSPVLPLWFCIFITNLYSSWP